MRLDSNALKANTLLHHQQRNQLQHQNTGGAATQRQTPATVALLHATAAHLSLDVLQVLLLLDWRQVGHIQSFGDALAGKFSTTAPLHHHLHAAKATLTQRPAQLVLF